MTRRLVIALVLLLTPLVVAASGRDWRSGHWTIRADGPDEVRLSLEDGDRKGHSQWQSDVPLDAFTGLDLSGPGVRTASFSIVRDAGRVDFEGTLDGDRGLGTFTFTPDSDYARRMEGLDFVIDQDQHFSMAIHDVSLAFAQSMRDADLRGLDADSLLAFRIHGVSLDFVESIRAVGQTIDESDELIAFRIHGVRADMIDNLRRAGYDPENDELLALRIHGATPEWVDELARLGYERLALDDLVAFRIHGVSPDFIGSIRDLGYERPAADELVAMRIHGVTPDFITELRDRGLGELTIDQLIGMRIHGIQ